MRTTHHAKQYRLLGQDGRPYLSATKGSLGGNRSSKIYGRLECPTALRAIVRGGYVTHRVFFASAADPEAAGYRPCGACLRDAYLAWKHGGREPRVSRA